MPKAKQKQQLFRNRIIRHGEMPACDFLANPQNFRRHPNSQRDAMRGILDEVGFVQSVIVSERTGVLLDGHLRVEESLSRNDAQPIPYVSVDVSEAEEKLILASLDPIGALAVADKEALDNLLRDVQTGEAALTEMLSDLAAENGLQFGDKKQEDESKVAEIIDRAAELQEKWKVERGQIWQIGRHRLMCGDSTNAEDVARLMDGETAALCFTSPPYLQQRTYEKSIGDWDEMMKNVFSNLIIAEDSQILVNLGMVHRENEWLEYWQDWVGWMRTRGYRKFGWYIWDQGHGLMGNWNGRFAPSHEFIFHFNKQAKQPNKIIPTKPASLQKAEAKKRGAAQGKKQQGLRHADGTISELYSLDKCGQEFKIPDSVVRIVREQARGIHTEGHPAVFPDELPAYFMEAFSLEGEICYEPFNGSGTSYVAAEQTNRTCYGMEIEPKYCAVTLERLSLLGLTPELTNGR